MMTWFIDRFFANSGLMKILARSSVMLIIFVLYRDEIGLSVNLAKACSPEDCAARFRSCYGVASLRVGDVRKIGLDVVQDSIVHANITGLPYRENDRLGADRLARLLAEISEIVWLP
jgi:hypothetical protein